MPEGNEGLPSKEKPSIFQINFKRVADRAVRLWYVTVLSLAIAITLAHLINRYSTPIYPVKASIIIKEGDENAGAKFLYDNELLNPYRNFYNEVYIMRSYPLLQGVMEELGFDVALYVEGDIKTSEYYDPHFPVKFKVIPTAHKPTGRSFYFTVQDSSSYSFQYMTDDDDDGTGKEFPKLAFNDTVKINGFSIYVEKRGSVSSIMGKRFIVRFKDSWSLAKSYSSRLTANYAQAGASVVNLDISGEVIQKEIDFLNKFIERYQQYDVEKKNKMATMAIKFLDEQLLVIGDSLNRYEDEVESFKHRNIITRLDEETSRLYQKYTDLEQQKFDYNLLNNYFKYVDGLLKNDQFDGIFTPNSVGIRDNVVADLVQELIEEQSKVTLYKRSIPDQSGMDSNPALQGKLRKIEIIKSDILKTIENTRNTNVINIRFIDDQIGLIKRQLSKLPSTERELVSIQRNYALKEQLYLYLLQKRTEAGLSRASTTSDIVVVNPPIASSAIFPNKGQNYGIAAGAGLFLPLLIFVIIEMFNGKIQSKDDIEKLTAMPVIAGIGHNPGNDQLIVYTKPRSAMAESFRALRSNLNYFTGNREHIVFMVTSSVPGEGKSFTSLNLASVFAMAGKRTVIVGADLRKPKLFEELGLENKIGLSQYLSGMVGVEEVIQTTSVENLYLISGGPTPPNPSELLMRPAMEKLMANLRDQFDYIIVDTPPLSYVSDAFVLSKYADHSLFLVRQDFTPKTALLSLDDFFVAGKLSKISILFNDLRKTGLGYGYGNYGYGYGYGYGGGYGYGYGINLGKKKKDDGEGYYS
ncbi:capsular biosynthesis protein [Pseudochryseolinea flava]|uniref:non-specific protein-tyrosine kinase n=1 Tax=Pseudochryseolinea flava TaxID=2059302 RepID=A0A364Y3W9_9BACT|nr:capsular biosynthesis protein [Pseudochryseolinea flava]